MAWTVEQSYLDLCNIYDEDGKLVAANIAKEHAYLIAAAEDAATTLGRITVAYAEAMEALQPLAKMGAFLDPAIPDTRVLGGVRVLSVKGEGTWELLTAGDARRATRVVRKARGQA